MCSVLLFEMDCFEVYVGSCSNISDVDERRENFRFTTILHSQIIGLVVRRELGVRYSQTTMRHRGLLLKHLFSMLKFKNSKFNAGNWLQSQQWQQPLSFLSSSLNFTQHVILNMSAADRCFASLFSQRHHGSTYACCNSVISSGDTDFFLRCFYLLRNFLKIGYFSGYWGEVLVGIR